MKNALLLIDFQNDFIDAPDFKGALAVNGAYDDVLRTVQYMKANSIDDIFVTVDTHSVMDIAHAAWWVDKEGKHPSPFTLITVDDVVSGKWMTADPKEQEWSLFYVKELAKNQKYTLCVWPDHCIKGSYGWDIAPEIKEALKEWELSTGKSVTYVYKGMNPRTEHYSGFKAEVLVESDAGTELNMDLIKSLMKYEKVTVAGEALSHCVASSVTDLLENIQDKSKVSILQDCMSSVTGFEANGQKFLEWAQSEGAVLESSTKMKLKI